MKFLEQEDNDIFSVSQSNRKSVKEIKEWYEKNRKKLENFKKIQDATKLADPTKSSTRTYSTFSKDKLRTYMKNPITNYKNLRNLSRFLYYRSSVYRRLIWYNATMIDTNARSVIPIINLTKENDKDKILKSYYQTLTTIENMNIALEFLKMYIIAWREDAAYGVAFYDDTGYFILPMDGEYCRVTGAYQTGDLSYSIDMSYFTKNPDMVEWIGEPFTSMYNNYTQDRTNGKWQPVPDEYCICFKINIDDYEVALPPMMSLFNSLISLSDQEDIQAVADEQQIYKIISATMPLIGNSKDPDDFAVDPATALEYFNKMVESFPDYIGAILSPIPLEVLEFGNDQTTDITKIENATRTVLNTSGGAQVLNSSTISGTTAWNGAIKSDAEYATASLRPQTEAYINRFLTYHISNPAKVKFLKVTPYTKAEVKKSLLEDATYGLPTILSINSLNGFSELETLSLNYLENDVLGLVNKFKPLQSSHTQSSADSSGGQEKSIDDLTDAGEASIDKRDKSNG